MLKGSVHNARWRSAQHIKDKHINHKHKQSRGCTVTRAPVAVPTPQPSVIHYGLTYTVKGVFLTVFFSGEVKAIGALCIAALRTRVGRKMFGNKFDTAPGRAFYV